MTTIRSCSALSLVWKRTAPRIGARSTNGARAALNATPDLSEGDITKERLALDESIRKVEAEAARQFPEPSRQPHDFQPRAAEPRVDEPRAPEPRVSVLRTETRERRWGDQPDPDAPPQRYVKPPSAGGQELRQDARAESRQEDPAWDANRDSIFDQPLPPEPAPAARRHPLRRPADERGEPHQDFSEPMLEPSYAFEEMPGAHRASSDEQKLAGPKIFVWRARRAGFAALLMLIGIIVAVAAFSLTSGLGVAGLGRAWPLVLILGLAAVPIIVMWGLERRCD